MDPRIKKVMRRYRLFVILIVLFSSCKTLRISAEERQVFKVVNQINYPHQKVLNTQSIESLQDLLTDKEISSLERFSDSIPFLENLYQTECVGCSNTVGNFKPMYRVKNGKFIHFGLQNDMGLENWVFNKRGAFVTRFYMFQGESQEEIHEKLKDSQSIDYVLEGLYPIKIDKRKIYLEHIAFENQSEMNNTWYQPLFPTKINYVINLAEKSPSLGLNINGGLYSYQRPNENGEYQIINFVEPLFYANAVDTDGFMSYSSFTDAFYANATFFMLNLEEDAEVSITIKSKTAGKDYKFSLMENEGFYTIGEYLKKEGTLFNQYQNTLKKGRYAIRIDHTDSDYAEKPLYTVYIDKKTVIDQRQ